MGEEEIAHCKRLMKRRGIGVAAIEKQRSLFE